MLIYVDVNVDESDDIQILDSLGDKIMFQFLDDRNLLL